MEARREARARAAAASKTRESPEHARALRAKFIAAVESYIGVPYSRKAHADDPSSPHHDAPLYLDCCGVIRRALRDLSDDFGFIPGHGNQAYQFDTLPTRVDGVDALEPGDLIFYECDVKPESGLRRQPHDMCHVEVFVGGETGEETIGSLPYTCWRTRDLSIGQGTCGVQRFKTFRCEETGKWRLRRYWFCKIDEWLRGECVSRCAEHDWRERVMCEGCAGSVFEIDDDADEAAE